MFNLLLNELVKQSSSVGQVEFQLGGLVRSGRWKDAVRQSRDAVMGSECAAAWLSHVGSAHNKMGAQMRLVWLRQWR
jgi:hypothetical protein